MNNLELHQIKKVVELHTGIKAEDMGKKTRKGEHIKARMLFYKALKENGKLISLSVMGESFKDTGHIFDHSTVLHALKTAKNLIETNKGFRELNEKVQKDVEDVLLSRQLSSQKDKEEELSEKESYLNTIDLLQQQINTLKNVERSYEIELNRMRKDNERLNDEIRLNRLKMRYANAQTVEYCR